VRIYVVMEFRPEWGHAMADCAFLTEKEARVYMGVQEDLHQDEHWWWEGPYEIELVLARDPVTVHD